MSLQARRNYQFENWARNQRCRPAMYHEPVDEEAVRALLVAITDRGERARFVGSGHSFSDIACTDGHLISLDRLSRVLDVDRERRLVTVEGGMRISALSTELAKHDLALHSLGTISEQTVAGAISTATHGTGARLGNLSSRVVGLRLVTPTGNVVDVGGADGSAAEELLPAAQVSLGALGAITQVTLRVEPSFNLLEETETRAFSALVPQIDDLVDSSEYLKLWWLPHTGRVRVSRYQRTQRSASPWQRVGDWLGSSLLRPALFPSLLRVGASAPALVPSISRFVARARSRRVRRVDRAPKLFNLPAPPRHFESEWALDRARCGTALSLMRELIAKRGLRINFVVEVRWVAGDQAWLSPAYERDTCHIGAYMFPTSDWRRYFGTFEALMTELGGRPHWGKGYRWDREHLRSVYPRFDDFDAARRELDPQGTLVNAFTARLFGSTTEVGGS